MSTNGNPVKIGMDGYGPFRQSGVRGATLNGGVVDGDGEGWRGPSKRSFGVESQLLRLFFLPLPAAPCFVSGCRNSYWILRSDSIIAVSAGPRFWHEQTRFLEKQMRLKMWQIDLLAAKSPENKGQP